MKLIQVSLNRTPGDFTLGGNLLFDATNTRDLGSTASKPRNVYAGTQFLAPDGTVNNVGFGFATSPNSGLLLIGAGRPALVGSGVVTAEFGNSTLNLSSGAVLAWNNDINLQRDAADTLALRRGANAQTLRVYNTFTDASNYERAIVAWQANTLYVGMEVAGSGNTGRPMSLYSYGALSLFTGGSPTRRWFVDTTGHFNAGANNAYDIGDSAAAAKPRSLYLGSPALTVGSGTGYTANNSGEVRRLTSKHTLTFAALQTAATTADKTLCTLPAKTRLVAVIMDVTAPFTGGTVASATLQLGKSVGGTEYLVAKDAFTAPATYGLTDADLGTSINRANAVFGGDMPSWSATTTLSVRLTVGGDTANHTTAGSVTFSIITEVSP